MTDLTNEERQMVAKAVRPMYLGTEAWAVIAHIKAEAGQAAIREYLERRDSPRIMIDLANGESQWFLDATVKAAKATALREAADELERADHEGEPVPVSWWWLRDRADRIEAER